MPIVTFDFRARGADAVRRSMQQVLDGAGAGRGGPARQAAQEQATTRATLREIAIRQRATERAAAATARAEARAGAASARETTKRQNAETAASVKRSREIMRWAESVERAEQRATRATERGAARRAAAETRATAARGRSWGQHAERAAGQVVGYAGTMHGQIQDARQRAAQTERTAGLAFFQAGATSREEIGARIAQTRAFAQANGMTSDELLSGANAAQTEFSSLQGGTADERQSRFTNMLSTMLLARNTGNDAGEFARLQGMLAQTGFDPALQRQTLLYTAGATQQGAVEARSMTREAMGSIMRRMQDAMTAAGPGASESDRTGAAAAAFREQVAELQVFRGRGARVGLAGNALANMQEALRGSSRQDKVLNNLRVAQESTTDPARRVQLQQLQSQLFEADPTRARGSMRLRANMQNPLAFAAAYAQTMGNDATGLTNILAGGGHGNASSLLQNQRALLGQLVAPDATGVTGAQRVMRLQNPNVALTEARVTEGAGIFGQDALSGLNRENEARDAALRMDNAATRFSDAVSRFAANNPFAATALGTALPTALGALASSVGRLAGTGGMGAVGGAAGSGGIVPPGGGVGATAAVTGALLTGAVLGDQLNNALQANGTQRNQRDGSLQDSNTFSVFSDGLSAFMQEFRGMPGEMARAISGAASNPQHAAMAAQLARADEAARQRRT